jgi:GGDEF domain-containing protein
MSNKRRGAAAQVIRTEIRAAEPCRCPSLPYWHGERQMAVELEADAGSAQVVPMPVQLSDTLRDMLSKRLPRTESLSLLLLHIAQLDHIHIVPQTEVPHTRQRYHAPIGLLDQVLANVQRAIRSDDEILTYENTAAALILPGVEQDAAWGIAERVYQSINLLQAETVIPPLKRETEILIGIGSYPAPGVSVAHLLYHAGLATHTLTLRPALTPQMWRKPTEMAGNIAASSHPASLEPRQGNIPFMELPSGLPRRLKQLIPHYLALELRCAPVGRDHHYLTVAMADPANTHAINRLSETTGLTIFPVSCDATALSALLAAGW